jgi:hypothetical protein
MYLSYGKSISTPSTSTKPDPDVEAVNSCLNRLGLALRPGTWKVDAFPFHWLRYVPGYLSQLKEGHKIELELFQKHMGYVRERMGISSNEKKEGEEGGVGGGAPESFGKYLLTHQDSLGLSDDEVAYLAGSMFGAGSDTTASAISIVIMASALHPEEQRKVQEELDRVVGRERRPTFEDREELKYLWAFVLESFRWRPVSAGGMYLLSFDASNSAT